MKTRLLLALASLLLAGCDFTVTLVPSATVLYQGDTATIGITLKNKTNLFQTQSQVTLTSNNPAVVFVPPAPAAATQTSIVIVNSPSSTTPGMASDTITATAVTHDTPVTIKGVWRFPPGNDPDNSVVVTVRPPRGISPPNGTNYLEVLPSVSGQTFTYEITAKDTAGGTPPPLVHCDLQFTAPVAVTLISAVDASGTAVPFKAVQMPNYRWRVWIPPPSPPPATPNPNPVTFFKLVVQAVSSDTGPGGTTMFTAEQPDGYKYITSTVGPLPKP